MLLHIKHIYKIVVWKQKNYEIKICFVNKENIVLQNLSLLVQKILQNFVLEIKRILSQNAVSKIFKYDLKLYLSVYVFLWAMYLRSHCHGKDTPHIILCTNVFSLQALCTPFFSGPRCISSLFKFWQDGNNSILFTQTHLPF